MRLGTIVLFLVLIFILASCTSSLPPEPSSPGSSAGEGLAGKAFFSNLEQSGYARPTNFSINKDSLLRGENLTLTVRNEDYVYKYYYLSVNGQWEKRTFPGKTVAKSNWLESPASVSFSTISLPEGDNYVVVYSCIKKKTVWDCRNNRWQIHQFKILPPPVVPPLNPQCGSNQECPYAYACINGNCVPQESQTPSQLSPAPQVFNTKFYQSPVYAEPDDVLAIPGYGFTQGAVVAYKQVSDHPVNPPPPSAVPSTNTVSEGKLYVASITPDSVTVILPSVMLAKTSYALWVKNQSSDWSEPVFINDPRPLWITPTVAYSTQQFAALPRELKVVGRNLEGPNPALSKVRLSGPTTYELLVINDANQETRMEHFVAKVSLPVNLQAGNYTVEYSRDGTTWIDLPPGRIFSVLPDPQPKLSFDISDYGGCAPNDGLYDTACIVNAISNASAAGGGEVYFPPGDWEIGNASIISDQPYYFYNGIVVKSGVDLVGAGIDQTRLIQTLDWKAPGNNLNNVIQVFTLQGNNKVRNIHFHSEGFNEPLQTYLWYFNLGKRFGTSTGSEPTEANDIIITNNKFTDMYTALGGGEMPSKRIFVANNIFHAYKDDFFFASGENYLKNMRYSMQDSVITDNILYAGDYIYVDNAQGVQAGVLAAELSGSKRLDFSNNHALGNVTAPWRAGFFWSMHSNNEELLIAKNEIRCTDKVGDGEAIAFDDNGNSGGFATPEMVVAATPDSISVNGLWLESAPGYYNQHWAVILDGKGVGQARKIVNYTVGLPAQVNPSVIDISPAWDVIPDTTSSVIIVRSYWNTYMIDNLVDMRGCAKANPTKQNAGVIGWTAMITDSALEGNHQFETNGIIVTPTSQEGGNVWCTYADEIRYNLIDGEYNYSSSMGGISLYYGSSQAYPSGLLGYLVSVSHNTIKHADVESYGGGIGVRPGWTYSPTPYQWKGLLIFKNNLQDIASSGIRIVENYTWDTVLYKNTFQNIPPDHEIIDDGFNTITIFCGNGKVEAEEGCDDGLKQKCAYGLTSCQVCSAQCTGFVTGEPNYCGDNACDPKHESTASCSQDCGLVCNTAAMVSWWQGEGNAKDVLENNSGKLNGDTSFVSGMVGNAFNFDGNGDYIAVGDPLDGSLDFGSDNFTLAFWGRSVGDGFFVSKGCASCGNGLGYDVDIANGGVTPIYRIDGDPDGGSTILGYSTSADLSQWHHYVGVYNRKGLLSMYLDGQLAGTSDISAENGSLDNTAQFVIGAFNQNTGYLNGQIDEVAVWRRTLSAAEVQAIYNAGSKGMCKP